MDDDHAQGSVPQGFFVFIGPAAVVSKRTAAKELRIGRGGLVGEQDQHLALDVHSFEIVPLKFRGDDAMADEYGFGIEVFGWLLTAVHSDEIFEPAERDGLARSGGRQRGVRRCLDADQRHFLEVGSVVASGLGSEEGDLGGDVFGGKALAANGYTTAFEQIAGEEFDVGANALAGDGLGLREGDY